ncbi:MAG TPA: hypothetical protein DEG71_03845, partial [Clostridiales bacterium]|nr:hypothetical protein [Clostridiales bacterium]
IKGYQTKDGFKEQKITKDEFNILVNTLGVLPSHAFSYDSITKLLTDAGMRVNRINMYHIDKGLEFLNPLDMIVENVSNATGLMKKSLGRDMFVVVINQKDK